MPTQERLQKILAAAGLGSRRACEEIIRQGRVAVNGQIAHLGQSADPRRDRITLDGKPVRVQKTHTYVALYKPVGVVSTAKDEEGRQTVVELVPAEARLYPVGRLDMLSEGLVLLTDDGELALRLTHPRYGQAKEYQIKVTGIVSDEALAQWRQGVLLDDVETAPAEVAVLRYEKKNTWLRIVLYEGRKREIRRVAELLGYSVQKLVRTRIGPVRLGRMKPGEWRYLGEEELATLRKIRKDKTAQDRSSFNRKGRRGK